MITDQDVVLALVERARSAFRTMRAHDDAILAARASIRAAEEARAVAEKEYQCARDALSDQVTRTRWNPETFQGETF